MPVAFEEEGGPELGVGKGLGGGNIHHILVEGLCQGNNHRLFAKVRSLKSL